MDLKGQLSKALESQTEGAGGRAPNWHDHAPPMTHAVTPVPTVQ
jgi:hypothetical protein